MLLGCDRSERKVMRLAVWALGLKGSKWFLQVATDTPPVFAQ
jgi:hypothetical protein